MSISSSTRKAGPSAGNGITTAFPFAFKVFLASDLLVVYTDANGIETTQTLTTQYTVSLNANQDANPGGTVNMLVAPPTGATLTIGSQVPETQVVTLTNNGGFYPTVINDALDKITILIQQVKERLGRSLTLPFSAPSSTSTTLPLPAANNVIGWNEEADALQNFSPETFATIVAFGTSNADKFSGDGVTTQFALTSNPGALNNLDVSISGVTQTPGVDYTWPGGTTLTFTVAPIAGSSNILVRYMQGLPAGVIADNSVGTSQIIDGAITAAKLAASAVSDTSIVSPSKLYDRITDIRSAIDYMTAAQAADVRTNAGTLDVTAAIQAAIDAAEAAGGGIVYCPAGKYKTTAKLTINVSGVFLVGDGPKATLFAPNFDTDPFIEFDSAGLLERVGIYNCEIAHTITRTAGPTIKFGRGYRMYVQDVETTSSYIGITVGDNAYAGQTVDCRIIRGRFNSSSDGAVVTGQSGIFFQGCKFNGVPLNSSNGINITGTADGVWLDDTTTIEQHDNGMRISHSSGSVANIYINGTAFDRMVVSGFRIDISGTASINGVYVDGLKLFDTVGSGNTDGILVNSTSSGTIKDLEFRGVSARDVRQRFANINAVVDGLIFHGCVSRRGGVKAANTYAGIELNSLAHTNVVITGCEINGSHDYGLKNAINSTNIVVTGNDFTGNVTGGWTNLGASSATRQFNDNIGTSGNPANTFTPAIASSGGGTPTYSVQAGCYEIVNGRCFFNLSVTLATLGTLAAGNVTITGMPVTSRNTAGLTTALSIRADTLAAGATTAIMAAIGVNSAVVTPAKYAAGARTNLTVADLAGTTTFEVSGSYPI